MQWRKMSMMADRVRVLLVLLCLMFGGGMALGDDLDPPSYRGLPLGIEAHWNIPAVEIPTGQGQWDAFAPFADGPITDPTIHVYGDGRPDVEVCQIQSQIDIAPGDPTSPYGQDSPLYVIDLCNWVDQEPLKIGRIQLTWSGSNSRGLPVIVGILGFDGSQTLQGAVVGQSTPRVFTQPDGGAMYFDFEIIPNPDWERIFVNLPLGNALTQVDIDTASIPEPTVATMLAAALAAGWPRRRGA